MKFEVLVRQAQMALLKWSKKSYEIYHTALCHIEAETNWLPLSRQHIKTYILTQISLICILNGPSRNKSALVQITAWPQTSNKPLSEPMMT